MKTENKIDKYLMNEAGDLDKLARHAEKIFDGIGSDLDKLYNKLKKYNKQVNGSSGQFKNVEDIFVDTDSKLDDLLYYITTWVENLPKKGKE